MFPKSVFYGIELENQIEFHEEPLLTLLFEYYCGYFVR